MLKDITIGQYYPARSFLHRLDPRIKIAGTLLYIISLFVMHTWGFLIGAGFLAAAVIVSKVPPLFMLRGLRPVWIILAITLALNLFLTSGTVIWSAGIFTITQEGAELAARNGVRFCMLIMGASIMTYTTTPGMLTAGLEKLMMPLSRLGVPVSDAAMTMSIALRFIPILMDEADRIMQAQKARGADFESGGLIRRLKALFPLLVPLFVSAFRRAGDLALAMDARCYGYTAVRTRMNPLLLEKIDYFVIIVLSVYIAAVILLRVFCGW